MNQLGMDERADLPNWKLSVTKKGMMPALCMLCCARFLLVGGRYGRKETNKEGEEEEEDGRKGL